ncbi:unnamed protein product [Notodromas monacha]|uniref:Anoctamin n=1 Tax=Notodromas monacha TaxID=399045 RepID=A0A7R9BLX1_9CRUS|nr:unnamed protein product [Notodromas monacha]CAG0916416.1 unnamed protein product [Notodromas monacha]
MARRLIETNIEMEEASKGNGFDRYSPGVSTISTPNEELFFSDGTRRIDFVLVYQKCPALETAQNLAAVLKRQVFEENLLDEGLHLEQDVQDDTNLVFVKIHAPHEVLTRYAELMKIRMPMKEVWLRKFRGAAINVATPNEVVHKFGNVCSRLFSFLNFNKSVFPPRSKNFTAVYSRGKEYLFNVSESMFNPAKRITVVDFILKRKGFTRTEGDAEIGIDKLLADNVYLAAFPLHEGDVHVPGSLRHDLRKYWGSLWMFYKNQPLDYVREYFGVKIGLYFAWLGYYTFMLFPASLVGFFCFLYGWFTLPNDPVSRDVCDMTRNVTMCPLCDKFCDFWLLNDSCLHAKINYLVDNPSTLFFAVFMSFWSALFFEFWKRYRVAVTHKWDLTGFNKLEEQPRPQYLAKLKNTDKRKMNYVTRQEEPAIPFWSLQVPMYLCSFSAVMMLILLALAAIFGVILYRMSTLTALSMQSSDNVLTSYAMMFTTVTAACLNLVCIMIFQQVYYKLAVWLTELESPRTQSEFDDSLTLKIYLLQFVNYYSSIFYIAFFKGKVIGYPGEYKRIFGFRQEECGVGVIQFGFVTIFVSAFPLAPLFALLNNIFEMRLDAAKLLTWYRRPVAQRVLGIGIWYDILDAIGKLAVLSNAFIIAFTSNFIPRLVYKITMSSNGTLDGFVEDSLAHFNVSDFSSLYAPNTTESITVCRYVDYRHPYWNPEKYQNTRTYWHILAARFAFIVIFQNVVFFMINVIRWMIPDVPKKLAEQIAREEFLTNQLIMTEELKRAKNQTCARRMSSVVGADIVEGEEKKDSGNSIVLRVDGPIVMASDSEDIALAPLKSEVEDSPKKYEAGIVRDETFSTVLSGAKEEGPVVSVTEVVKKGRALVISGRASFPATTTDALIENIVLGRDITDFDMFFDDDESDDGMPRDVDRGWAWMVLFGGFLAFSVLSGLFNTMSIYYVVFVGAFGNSKPYTAWASSLHAAFSFLGGPLSSMMILRIGSLGLSLNFSGWVIALGTYFNKKHSIATALAMTGFGCGLFFLGPGMEASVNYYGWRGSMILNAGIALQFCVFGALVYPITFTGYMSQDGDDETFEKKFFKDEWGETQSLPPPESERLLDEKPQLPVVEERERKISTLGELRTPPADFCRPLHIHSTVSMDTALRRTAFAYVPGKSHVSELGSKRTYSSASIRSLGSTGSMHGSMRDMKFSPAAAFLSHSIRSLNEMSSGQGGGRRPYITIGVREGSSNSSLPFLSRSRESVKSLEDFRVRSSSFREESERVRTRTQVYRKPQPVEEVENVAEDLVKSLNAPEVVSFKPRKPEKVGKGKKHKHAVVEAPAVKEDAAVQKVAEKEPEPVAEAETVVEAEEKKEEPAVSKSPEKKNEPDEVEIVEDEEEEDDDDDESAEVWKLKAAMKKAGQRAVPPKASFFRFLYPQDENPRTISNIEEVDESSAGSILSLNAIFRRKSREVLSRLSEKVSSELLALGGRNAQSDKQQEDVPGEICQMQGDWKSHLKALWHGEDGGDLPLFQDPRFWCFNYSGLVWIMGTLTLYVLYKDFALKKGIVERFIYALSGLGLGDLIGRLFSGTFVSWSCVNSVLVYALVQLACGIIILYHITITNSEEFIILCVCLGICYGTQNVLLAVAPAEVYGSSHLTVVFGYILFFCGIGAILGPPIASLLLQHYNDYFPVFIFAGTATLTGGLVSLICFYIDWRWRKEKMLKREQLKHRDEEAIMETQN